MFNIGQAVSTSDNDQVKAAGKGIYNMIYMYIYVYILLYIRR